MQNSGIQGIRPRRYVHTTNSKHLNPIAENILGRNFDPSVIGGVNRDGPAILHTYPRAKVGYTWQ